MFYIMIFIGLAQITDSVFDIGLFSSDFFIKYFGRKTERTFIALVGSIILLISVFMIFFY